jgi:peptidylprolyl isomerase
MIKNLNFSKLFSAFAVVVLFTGSTLLLSSCNETSIPNANDQLSSLTVTKNGTKEPKVDIDSNEKISVEIIDETSGVGKQIVKILDPGDGNQVESGESVSLSFVSYLMPSKHKDISTWDGDIPAQKVIAFAGDETPNSLSQVLIGLREGAVVAIAEPGFNDESTEIDKTGTNYNLKILVIDKVENPVTKASGKSVPETELRKDLPHVTIANDGTPSISVPASFVPSSGTISQQLKIGDGAVVSASDIVSFQYAAWDISGAKLQSTWDTKFPLKTSVASINNAWKDVVVGATTGSQFLIIAPKDDSTTSSADDDIIYVIDVLEVN